MLGDGGRSRKLSASHTLAKQLDAAGMDEETNEWLKATLSEDFRRSRVGPAARVASTVKQVTKMGARLGNSPLFNKRKVRG